MSLNLERAAMRGRLAEAEARLNKLELRINGNCNAVRQGLNTALYPVKDLDVPMIATQMDELVEAWGDYQTTLVEIERLQRELHG